MMLSLCSSLKLTFVCATKKNEIAKNKFVFLSVFFHSLSFLDIQPSVLIPLKKTSIPIKKESTNNIVIKMPKPGTDNCSLSHLQHVKDV
jgi:hypothetical protein